MTRGLRLESQVDGELLTNGMLDSLENVCLQPVLVLCEGADELLEELAEGIVENEEEMEEESSDVVESE